MGVRKCIGIVEGPRGSLLVVGASSEVTIALFRNSSDNALL